MYHSAAYSSSIALTSTNQPLLAIQDSVFKIGSQNGFVLQEDMMLISAFGGGVGMANPRLFSPKLAQFSPLFITPHALTLSAAIPSLAAIFPYRPFTFRNQEEVTSLVDNTNAGAQQMVLACDFSNGIEQIPPGEILTITGTSTTAAVANAWTTVAYTLGQTLPEGVYAMLTSELISTTALYHRWTFWGQFYRPGNVSATSFNVLQSQSMPWLTKGLMGRFSNVTLPNLEVLAGAADAAHTFRARVIKVA